MPDPYPPERAEPLDERNGPAGADPQLRLINEQEVQDETHPLAVYERAQEPAGTLSYPGLEINLEQRRVFKNGQEVCMSRYEYGVLSLMAQHPGQLFTKEQIFEAVWQQDSESCLTAVTNTIGRIRQKIEDDRSAPVYIRTISNLGYQFMPNVLVEKDSL